YGSRSNMLHPSRANSTSKMGDRSHSFIIPPKLALPSRQKIQDTELQLFGTMPTLDMPEAPLSHSLQLQHREKEGQNHRAIQAGNLRSAAEESISHLDTMLMIAVKPR